MHGVQVTDQRTGLFGAGEAEIHSVAASNRRNDRLVASGCAGEFPESAQLLTIGEHIVHAKFQSAGSRREVTGKGDRFVREFRVSPA